MLMAVGDIMAGDHPHFLGVGVGSAIRRGVCVFEHIAETFAKADIVFGNLETPLASAQDSKHCGDLVLKSPSEFIEQLKTANFNVINIANNHILQHGEHVFWNTVALLRESGALVTGMGPGILEVGGRRFGFLGYSLRPEIFSDKVLYDQQSKERIIEECARLSGLVDYLILSLHWGEEFIGVPSREQVDFARALVDNGADVVLGHHPHVLQPIEKYKGGVIAYSLGNFVSDMLHSDKCRKSVILRLLFSNKGSIEVAPVPVKINDCYQPVALLGKEGEAVVREVGRSFDVVGVKDYDGLVKKSIRRDRCDYLIFLLKNLHKFPLKSLVYILKEAVKRRVLRIVSRTYLKIEQMLARV